MTFTQAQLVATVAEQVATAMLADRNRAKPVSRPVSGPSPRKSEPTRPTMPVAAPPAVADITAKERFHLEVCIHEAAHAVVGVVLGARLRSAAVTNSRLFGIQGAANFSDRPHGTDPLMAYAGPYGQAKFRAGGRRPTMRQISATLSGGGSKDAQALSLAGGYHLGHDAVPIIDRTWPAITRVAKALHKSGEVTEADVLAHLGVTDGGGLTSVQLASLRSGCRAVPA